MSLPSDPPVQHAAPASVGGAAPLAGILVADFSRVLAGPLATMILADLGATVVKVERPGVGDDTRTWGPPWFGSDSTYSLAVNRGKRSLTLDLKDAGDLGLAWRLARRADVLVENLRPGAMQGYGFGYDELAAVNPGLVYASISGFGSAPEARELGGYDFLVQAVSGLMSITGEPDGEPTKVGVALVDVMCGLYATIGIQAALAERARSGRGQQVEVSLLGAALAGLVNQASALLAAGVVPGRLANRHPSIAPYETFPAADRSIALAVGSDRLFARLVAALGLNELASDPRFATNAGRVAHREQLAAQLIPVLRAAPAAQWVAQLRSEGIPAGVVNDLPEAFAEAAELGLDAVVDTVRSDGTRIPTVRSPIGLSRTPAVVGNAPPTLGEHDAELRAWLAADVEVEPVEDLVADAPSAGLVADAPSAGLVADAPSAGLVADAPPSEPLATDDGVAGTFPDPGHRDPRLDH